MNLFHFLKSIILLPVISMLLVSGCVANRTSPQGPDPHYGETLALVVKRVDNLTRQTEYTGPPFPNAFLTTNVFLRAIQPPNLQVLLYQLYIVAYYKSECSREYNQAMDTEGNPLNMEVLLRTVGNRTGHGSTDYYEEHLIINLPREYLEAHQTNGIAFRISGPGGKEEIILPHYYIKAFLDTVCM
jgi:hypothetical protein